MKKSRRNKKLPVKLSLLKLPFKYFTTITTINIANLGIKVISYLKKKKPKHNPLFNGH